MLDAKHQKQMQHILELLISNGKHGFSLITELVS